MNKRVLVLSVPVFFAFSVAMGLAQSPSRTEIQDAHQKSRSPVPPPIVLPGIPARETTAAPIEPRRDRPTSPQAIPSVQQQRVVTGTAPLQPSMPQVVVPAVVIDPKPVKPLSARDFQTRLAEAERLLKSKPALTSYSLPGLSAVRLALFEPSTSSIHIVSVGKDTFLVKGAQAGLITSLGKSVHLNVLRANGVNTAVLVYDDQGNSYIPLVVEFPIEKFGAVREIAYYTSAHPTLLSSEIIKDGQTYVRTMLDLATKRLKLNGISISPNVVDAAERLCVVEHTDHDRFKKENRISLFQEIYSLYALNQLDTFRYSVSFAGAGGMVQMIPSTYQMLRRAHPIAGLNPDFVAGMRNHGNALEAMLLYMQDTWNDLSSRPDVMDALSNKTATSTELMAAGYNSNPAKLPGYLKRGGIGWRNLIPRETQMYLQIYQSLDSVMQFKSRD